MEELIQSYGNGAAILLKMGYVPGGGLGKNGSGIVEPIIPKIHKKGEGIKVNSMVSKVVDDWSDSEDELESDDESAELGFKKSSMGDYKSDYNLPDLFTLVHDLRRMDVKIPQETLELIDSKRLNNDQEFQLRSTFWNVLKNVKLEIPKLKYLEFEINNLKKEITKFENYGKIVKKCYQVIEKCSGNYDDDLSEIYGIESANSLTNDLKSDIMQRLYSRVYRNWNDNVMSCDVANLGDLCRLLELGKKYTELSNFFGFDPCLVSRNTMKFSLLYSLVTKPLILDKTLTFYFHEWNVENFNIGIGVFEELKESEIFNEQLFNRLVVDNIIMVRIKKEIDSYELSNTKDEAFRWLLEWFTVLGNGYFTKLMDLIRDRYCAFIGNYGDDDLNLNATDLSYWIAVSNSEERFVQEVSKSINHYVSKRLRCLLKPNLKIDMVWNLVGHKDIFRTIAYLVSLLEDNETGCQVVYREIFLPVWYANRLLVDSGDAEECERFMRELTMNLSQVNLLTGKTQKSAILITLLHQCYEELNILVGDSRFTLKKSINDCLSREEIWIQYTDPGAPIVELENRSVPKSRFPKSRHLSIKEILFDQLEKLGVSIIPSKYDQNGKQIYSINGQKRFNICFDDKLIYIQEGDEYEPRSIQDILDLVR